jgi:transcriptional regulator with XRE-family HTH domain
MEHIGQRLKWFRDWLKERQDVFAGRMNVSKTTLISYEHGETDPGASKLNYLYNSVKNTDWEIDLNWFITGEGEPFREETREYKIELELRKRIDELQQELIGCIKTQKKG